MTVKKRPKKLINMLFESCQSICTVIIHAFIVFFLTSASNFTELKHADYVFWKKETLFECTCVDRFISAIDNNSIIRKIQIQKNDSLTDFYEMNFTNQNEAVLFHLVLHLEKNKVNIVSNDDRKWVLFSFEDSIDEKTVRINSSYSQFEPFGNQITDKKQFYSRKLDKVLYYKLYKSGNVNFLNAFIYSVVVSKKYGILSFGYYNGNRKLNCVSEKIKNPKSEIEKWKIKGKCFSKKQVFQPLNKSDRIIQ